MCPSLIREWVLVIASQLSMISATFLQKTRELSRNHVDFKAWLQSRAAFYIVCKEDLRTRIRIFDLSSGRSFFLTRSTCNPANKTSAQHEFIKRNQPQKPRKRDTEAAVWGENFQGPRSKFLFSSGRAQGRFDCTQLRCNVILRLFERVVRLLITGLQNKRFFRKLILRVS
jgi:hypothetical protein